MRTTASIEDIVKCCAHLSENYIGALIVVERNTKIGDIINTGTQMDSQISFELLTNIFTPNTPLHDGAVIIRSNKIKAAACYLPLTGTKASVGSWDSPPCSPWHHEVSMPSPLWYSENPGKILCPQRGAHAQLTPTRTLKKPCIAFFWTRKNKKSVFG